MIAANILPLYPSNASPSAINLMSQINGSSNKTDAVEEEPVLLSLSLTVVLGFICLLFVLVNGLVVFLIYKRKTLRSLSNMFLTLLAFSDLFSGLAGFPLLFFSLKSNLLNICVSSTIFFRFTAISSVCHVLLIACDRYIAIVHLLKHPTLLTKWRAVGATVFVWLFSSGISVIQFSWYTLDETSLKDY